MLSGKSIFIIFLIIGIVSIVITSLISYYLSKWWTKLIKGVKRIDNRKDLDRMPSHKGAKLREIIKIVRKVSQIYKIKMPEVGVYSSNEVNAFATGPAGNTLIAFSSNLVNIMSMEEIKGVVAHELSHLIHYDIARVLLVSGIFDFFHLMFSLLLAWFLFQPKKDEEDAVGYFIRQILKYILFEIITVIVRLIGIMILCWYNRKRELKADLKGAEIAGVDNMLAALQKLLFLENKAWIVDGVDLTEDERTQETGEPNSISLLKFNPEKKKRSLLDLFRTHPHLEERIARLERLKMQKNSPGII